MRYSNKLIVLSTAVVTTAVFIFTACKKNDSTSATDTGFSTETATADRTFEDAQTASDQAATTTSTTISSNFRTTIGGCATITRDSNTSTTPTTHTDTITFTSGCTSWDGKMRTGSIILTYQGQYNDSGATHSITFYNYTVDGNAVSNSSYRNVTNMGGNVVYVTDEGSILMSGATNSIRWSAHRIRTWTAGFSNVPNILADDKYSVTDQTGYADTLVRANGNVVTNLITSAVLYDYSCTYRIVGGTIVHTFANNTSATLVYNTSGGVASSTPCTGEATLTYNGHTYTINL